MKMSNVNEIGQTQRETMALLMSEVHEARRNGNEEKVVNLLRKMDGQNIDGIKARVSDTIASLSKIEEKLSDLSRRMDSTSFVKMWGNSGLGSEGDLIVSPNNAISIFVMHLIQEQIDELNKKYEHSHFFLSLRSGSLFVEMYQEIVEPVYSMPGIKFKYTRKVRLINQEIKVGEGLVTAKESDITSKIIKDMIDYPSEDMLSMLIKKFEDKWSEHDESDLFNKALLAGRNRIYDPRYPDKINAIRNFDFDNVEEFLNKKMLDLKQARNQCLSEFSFIEKYLKVVRVKAGTKKRRKELGERKELEELISSEDRLKAIDRYLEFAQAIILYFSNDSRIRKDLTKSAEELVKKRAIVKQAVESIRFFESKMKELGFEFE